MGNRFCSGCQKEYPATSEWFYKQRKGFASKCKSCIDKENQQWADGNPQAAAAIKRRYFTNHLDRVAATRHRRRMATNRGNDHTARDIQLQYKAQGGYCWWCGKPLNGKYHIDHRIPLDRGGGNHAGNIVLAHAKCNLSKGAKLPSEWNGRLL
jgi:5-methylcytosine-specific restriction endonuclease McrA